MDFQDNYLIALKRHDLLSDRIYQGYNMISIYMWDTIHIPCLWNTGSIDTWYQYSYKEWSEFLLYTSSDCKFILSCHSCVAFADQMKGLGQFRIQFKCNEQSIQSFRFFTRTWSIAFAIRNKFVSQFSEQASVKALRHIGHLSWRHPLLHLSPRFKLLPATRLGKQKAARDTAAAAAVTDATSNRRGTLAAVGLSFLWAAFSPSAIAMVARGIKHSWSPR